MKTRLLGLLLVPITVSALGAVMATPGAKVAAQDRMTMKDDFPVLAQTVETQPWAVAILEDQKFDDVDVTVRANALENDFCLCTMINGKRSTIAS